MPGLAFLTPASVQCVDLGAGGKEGPAVVKVAGPESRGGTSGAYKGLHLPCEVSCA